MRGFGRIVVVVLLIAVVWGIGYAVWNAGYDQGLIDAAETTTEIVVAPRYGAGFFPFGAIFGFFILLLLFKAVFGWRHWGRRYPGTGPGGYRGQMHDRMTRWHDEAHGRTAHGDPPDEPASPIS